MAEEKSHDNMDLSNKNRSLETEEEGLNLDHSDQWEMLQFSPPSPIEITLRYRAVAEDKFFLELLLQLTDKILAARKATKDEFHHRVINKCLTQLDILKIMWTQNRECFNLGQPKLDFTFSQSLDEPEIQQKKMSQKPARAETLGISTLHIIN